jgi:hypothetical protein
VLEQQSSLGLLHSRCDQLALKAETGRVANVLRHKDPHHDLLHFAFQPTLDSHRYWFYTLYSRERGCGVHYDAWEMTDIRHLPMFALEFTHYLKV